jgi:hypothetical protein
MILSKMIPEMIALSGGYFMFQQMGRDGTHLLTCCVILMRTYSLQPHHLPPEKWPPKGPDLSTIDHAIWAMLEAEVCKVKIGDLDHLEC